MPIHDWKAALNRFAIIYEDRTGLKIRVSAVRPRLWPPHLYR